MTRCPEKVAIRTYSLFHRRIKSVSCSEILQFYFDIGGYITDLAVLFDIEDKAPGFLFIQHIEVAGERTAYRYLDLGNGFVLVLVYFFQFGNAGVIRSRVSVSMSLDQILWLEALNLCVPVSCIAFGYPLAYWRL